ncbi:MAG TPA: polysaccharide deacetylase family protein, partial [Gemmatimonadales bacterium]
MGRASVLCYHLVGGPLALGVTRVSRRAFGRQMLRLARTGWRTLTLDEFADRGDGAENRSGRVGARDRSFLLTFDDGYASLADYAYPVLSDLGYTATTFLVTDYVGRMNTWDLRYTWRPLPHLDWRAIETWQARGFDFGSHTASHERLTWLDESRAEDELARSRAALVARLGGAAGRAIAYPFGATDARVERLARAAGYELGFGGVRG